MSEIIRTYDNKGNIIYERQNCQDCNNILDKRDIILDGYICNKRIKYMLCRRCIQRKGIIERVKDVM